MQLATAGPLEGRQGKQRQWAVSGPERGARGDPSPPPRLATSLCCLHRGGGPCLLSTQGPKPPRPEGPREEEPPGRPPGPTGQRTPSPPALCLGLALCFQLLPHPPQPGHALAPQPAAPLAGEGSCSGGRLAEPAVWVLEAALPARPLQAQAMSSQDTSYCAASVAAPGRRLLRPRPPAGAGAEPTAWRKPPSLGCQTEPRAGARGALGQQHHLPAQSPCLAGPGRTGFQAALQELAPGPGPDGPGPGLSLLPFRDQDGERLLAPRPTARLGAAFTRIPSGRQERPGHLVRGGPMTDPGWQPMRPGHPLGQGQTSPRGNHCSLEAALREICFLISEDVSPTPGHPTQPPAPTHPLPGSSQTNPPCQPHALHHTHILGNWLSRQTCVAACATTPGPRQAWLQPDARWECAGQAAG